MATVTRYPFVRHLQGAATAYVALMRAGRVVKEGVGASVWFRPVGSVLSEVPVDDRELPLLVHGRTRDFFDVVVQGVIGYRVVDPRLAAARVDFSLDPASGQWRERPLEHLSDLMTQIGQECTAQVLARQDLRVAVDDGVPAVRDAIAQGLAADPRVSGTGLEIVAVRVLGIRPEPEVERALQTPARELVQAEADRATFERRAHAVEQEAAIGQNELANQIELARRDQELVEQRGRNEERAAELAAVRREVEERAAAEAEVLRAQARAEAVELIGAAEAGAEAAKLQAYAQLPRDIVLALALRELATHMPDLRSLVVSPDALAPLTQALAGAGAGRPEPER